MHDKCWCEKELVETERCDYCDAPASRCSVHQGQHWVLADSTDPNSGGPCGAIISVSACPDHGADCVWRRCPEYEGPMIPGADLRNDEGESPRECKLLLRLGVCFHCAETGVFSATCASCPIPAQARKAALWDACGELMVEAVGDSVATCQPQRLMTCERCQERPGQGMCIQYTALLAVAEAEKEAAL